MREDKLERRLLLINMHHTLNPLPHVNMVNFEFNLGALSLIKIDDFYKACSYFDVKIHSCEKVRGLINKKYIAHLEGFNNNLIKLEMWFNSHFIKLKKEEIK